MYFMNGPDKVFVGNNLYNKDNYNYLKFGVVESIEDPFGMGRIKVRVKGNQNVGGDDGILTDDLPWAFPLIPKHVSTIPKVGEVVWIFVLGKDRQRVDRLYIGPIISQLDKLNLDKYDNGSALRGFSFSQVTPNKPVTGLDTNKTVIPELIGVFPKADEISIQGRYNTDITQKDNEVVIRAGKFEASNSNEFKIAFNAKTQGFIQIKNDVRIPIANSENTEKGTVMNLVSSKINLLTHKDGTPNISLNQNDLISDEELKKILTEAHQVPFGDILLEYLRLLKDAILSHVHNGNGNPSTDLTSSGNIQAIAALKNKAEDLENRMLSKNIRIN